MPGKRPLFHRILQRNYLGAGNPIDSAEAVDSADAIAKDHDIVYQSIQESGVNLESVNRADWESANEFFVSAASEYESGSVSSAVLNALSGAALTGKRIVEKTLGQPLYPKMGKRIHRKLPEPTKNPLDQTPNRVYRMTGYQLANLRRAEEKLARMRAAKAPLKDIQQQEAKIAAVKSHHKQLQEASGYHREAQNQARLFDELADYEPSAGASQQDVESVIQEPPQTEQPYTGFEDMFNKFYESATQPPSKKQHLSDLVSDDFEDDIPIDRSKQDLPVENTGIHDLAMNNIEELNQIPAPNVFEAVSQTPMEISDSNQQVLLDLGANNMNQVQQVIRSKGVRYIPEEGCIEAEYSRLFYSWGYNFKALDIQDKNDTDIKQKFLMTPLAYVPVDHVPFLMPQSLYDDLPNEADIVQVRCKVTPWGTRVSFQTNADTSAPATAQHVDVGLSAIGLNLEPTFNWANRDVTESSSMIISTHAAIDTSKIIKKLWGSNDATTLWDNVPTCFGAIRQLDIYGGPVVDNYVASAVGPPVVAEYKPTGWPDLETKMNRFALQAHIGKPIINYEYTPKFGILKAKSRRFQSNRSNLGGYAYNTKGNELRRVQVDNVQRTADTAKNQTGTSTSWNQVAQTQLDVSPNPTYFKYDSMVDIDHAKFYSGDIGKECSPQPQLHIGIEPQQANQPGTSTGFVCAAAYWQIDTAVKIKINFGSAFNLVVARPIDHMVSYYNDAMDDTFAMQGTINGKVPLYNPYN